MQFELDSSCYHAQGWFHPLLSGNMGLGRWSSHGRRSRTLRGGPRYSQQNKSLIACIVMGCLLHLGHGYAIKAVVESNAGGGGGGGGESEMTKGKLEMAPEGHLHLQEDYEIEPYAFAQLKPVSVDYFSAKFENARSYHDVYRIFYGNDYSNDAIDKILTSRAYGQGSSMLGAPRIGGLAGPRHELEVTDAAVRHREEVEARIVCKDPTPEVYKVRDLSKAVNKVYFPTCTVVHRCRGKSGCCPDGYECAATRTAKFRRSFWVGKYVQGDYKKILPDAPETIEFVNHTECGCKPVKRLPKCLPCPYPFSTRRQNTTNCTCYCDDHATCERIRKGRKALTEMALRCIKDNRCAQPTCQYGEFNVLTGYCPKPNQVDVEVVDESNSGNDSDPALTDPSVVKSSAVRRALQ